MIKKIKRILVIVCIGFMATSVAPPAQANGLVDFFFPSLRKKEPDPGQTLQAPFMTPDADKAPMAQAQQGLPENAIPLDQPHRTPAAIGEWLVQAVSESLTFPSDDYKADLEKTVGSFDPTGRSEYLQFLQNTSIQKVLESKRFYLSGFAEEMPETLTSGPVKGTYHWLFRVPVMLSYRDRSMTDYKKAEPVSQEVVLTIQVGRSATAENGTGVLIERWDGKLQAMNKK